jgi:anti-sigma factor (TIGR02949 family)
MDCTNTPHDCSQVISRVFLALDGELSQHEMQVFMDELNRCSWCLEQFHIEKAFKEFLRSRIERKEIKSDLISRIRDGIKNISIE